MLPCLPTFTFEIFACHLSVPVDKVLVNHQTLQPYRSPSMDLIRTDSYLRSKPKTHPVRHARARVPEYTSAVNACLEPVSNVRRSG